MSGTRKSKRGTPSNPKLYARVRREAKKRFKAWPSAYGSGWLVKEYKRRGGKYSGKKPGRNKGLERWFREKWINVCELPKIVPCGRPTTSYSAWKKEYPYCRPKFKVSKGTPKIASKLSEREIERRCKKKRRNPSRKVKSKRSRSRRGRSPTKRSRSRRRRSPTKRSRRKSSRSRTSRRD